MAMTRSGRRRRRQHRPRSAHLRPLSASRIPGWSISPRHRGYLHDNVAPSTAGLRRPAGVARHEGRVADRRRGFTWGKRWNSPDVPHIEWAAMPPNSIKSLVAELDRTNKTKPSGAAGAHPPGGGPQA